MGFIRDMALASLFPPYLSDPFLVAFRIPNTLRRFVAEGAFSISVIPVYSKLQKPEDQKALLNALFTVLTLGLFALTIILIIFAPQLVALYAPGFEVNSLQNSAVNMLRVMFPYLAFLSLVALCMGVLNSHHIFFAPAAAPIILNMFFIAGLYLQKWGAPSHMMWVCWAVSLSGFFQLLFQLPYLKRIDRFPSIAQKLWSPEVKRVLMLWLPATWSVSIVQMTTLVGTHFASHLPAGTITGLYLAERIVELPLGVFAVSIGTVSLPMLSKLLKQSRSEYNKTLNQGIVLSAMSSLPSSVGVYLLADIIVQTFFFRQHADSPTAVITIECLRMYSLGLPFGSVLRSFAAAYHSYEKMKIPATISSIVLAVYFLICKLTYTTFQHRGLALGSTTSVALNAILLLSIFHFTIHRLEFRSMLPSLCKIVLATAVMAVLVIGMKMALFGGIGPSGILRWIYLGLICGGGALSFTGAVYLMKIPEAGPIFQKLSKLA